MTDPRPRTLVTGARWTARTYAVIAGLSLLGLIDAVLRSAYLVALIAAAVSAVVGLLAHRLGRVGIFDTGPDLLARSELSTTRVPWQEIDHFEHRAVQGLGASRHDGQWIYLLSLSRWGDAVPRALSALNQELARRRDTGP